MSLAPPLAVTILGVGRYFIFIPKVGDPVEGADGRVTVECPFNLRPVLGNVVATLAEGDRVVGARLEVGPPPERAILLLRRIGQLLGNLDEVVPGPVGRGRPRCRPHANMSLL